MAAAPARPSFRLAPGWAIVRLDDASVRLTRYAANGRELEHVDIPGITWVSAELAVSPVCRVSEDDTAQTPDDAAETTAADEVLVRHELERIHFGRAAR